MESTGNCRQTLGKLGEDIACNILTDMGHVILERNWRSGHLEVDIISFDPDGIHFVEVKTRRFNIQAPPQESVDWTKQSRIAKAARGFLRTRKGLPYGNNESHFDIMAITFKGETWTHEWFPQAYIPIYL